MKTLMELYASFRASGYERRMSDSRRIELTNRQLSSAMFLVNKWRKEAHLFEVKRLLIVRESSLTKAVFGAWKFVGLPSLVDSESEEDLERAETIHEEVDSSSSEKSFHDFFKAIVHARDKKERQ